MQLKRKRVFLKKQFLVEIKRKPNLNKGISGRKGLEMSEIKRLLEKLDELMKPFWRLDYHDPKTGEWREWDTFASQDAAQAGFAKAVRSIDRKRDRWKIVKVT